MEGSSADDLRAPESWEVTDLDESLSRLKLSLSTKKDSKYLSSNSAPELVGDSGASMSTRCASSSSINSEKVGAVSEDLIKQVDQFLLEALQNPRERLSVLRMEQDIEKFIQDPMQQQLEFQQFPTSYLRLAAHRVAQHYSLQSTVLLDSNTPDGSGSRIIVRKTYDSQLPLIRLANIPVNLPSKETSGSTVKVAIKQRAQERSHGISTGNSHSSKTNSSKSVEERKEEYNKARARIFNSDDNTSSVANEDRFKPNSLGIPKKEKSVSRGSVENTGRSWTESSTGNNREVAGRSEVEQPIGRYRPNNRVAIFRDRVVDRNDPDYDRNYDRYLQRFDPGFGFIRSPYNIQPMYTPAVNYNTEFPQLGSAHRPQISTEHCHPSAALPRYLAGQWTEPANPAGLGYGHHQEAVMSPFNQNHVGVRSTSGIYLHSSQYPPCQHPGMNYMHPHEHAYQHFSQSDQQQQQQQPDASNRFARPQ